MRLYLTLALTACSFTPGAPLTSDDAPVDDDTAPVGVDPPWWDAGWGKRQRLVVTTGPVVPDKGYAGYTVRVPAWSGGCDDLRVVVWQDPTWTLVPHHLIGCTDLRFALPVALGASETWREAFVYYDNPAVPPPSALAQGDVYLFWDPGTMDSSAAYERGRMDPWLSTGHDNSLAHDSGGFYTYDTGDNSQSSYRIALDERDVLVEAEWAHTGCYSYNMQSGVCARGVIATGTGASETSTHYYCSSRAQNPGCANNDQGIYDGDIVAGDNETIAVQGLTDPPPIVPDQWRRQALAVFGTNPTELRFWDADVSWPALATPPATALQATGTHAADHEDRGFAGVMTSQDIGRFRNLVVRRYVEPEPSVTVDVEELRPAMR